MAKSLTPAQKGAITRKKNMISARQRKAAFKAWKTIRANAKKNSR